MLIKKVTLRISQNVPLNYFLIAYTFCTELVGIMSIVKIIPETLLAFTPKLKADLKQSMDREFDSFLLYLELCSCMIKSKFSMRVVFNYIQTVYDKDVDEEVNSRFPPKHRSVIDEKYSKARTKFRKSLNQTASDKLNKMCNKILAFLKAIKGNTLDRNQEYKMLQSIVDSERKETLEAWITSLPSNEWFKELLKPEAFATEMVFVEANYDRNDVKSKRDQVIRAVKDLSVSNVEDLTEEDVDKVVKQYSFKGKQKTQNKWSSLQKQKTIELVAVYKSYAKEAESTSGAVSSSVQSHPPAESMVELI